MPDFLGFVLQAKRGEEKDFDGDVDARDDRQPLAVGAKRHAMIADCLAAMRRAKANVGGCAARAGEDGREPISGNRLADAARPRKCRRFTWRAPVSALARDI